MHDDGWRVHGDIFPVAQIHLPIPVPVLSGRLELGFQTGRRLFRIGRPTAVGTRLEEPGTTSKIEGKKSRFYIDLWVVSKETVKSRFSIISIISKIEYP